MTGRNKRAIEDHFDANHELDTMLRARGKDAQAHVVRNIIPEGVECILGCVYGKLCKIDINNIYQNVASRYSAKLSRESFYISFGDLVKLESE